MSERIRIKGCLSTGDVNHDDPTQALPEYLASDEVTPSAVHIPWYKMTREMQDAHFSEFCQNLTTIGKLEDDSNKRAAERKRG